MADAKTTDALDKQDDTEELIPVEEPVEPEDNDDDSDDDEDEDDGDERLGDSEEDETEDEKVSRNRRRRKRRAEMARKAKEHKERELAELRAIVAQQQQRLAAVEGFATSNVAQTLEQRIAQTRAEIRTAENIYVKAGEAGNYADQLAADKIRQQAQRELEQLEAAKADFSRRQQGQQPQQQRQQPQVDPQVVSYAKQWLEANPWYDPQGGDEDSAITRQIDAELVAEGFNPKTRQYWEELTSRVAEAIGDDEPAKPKRRAPPKGNSRGDAAVSSKKQIYVTPERKAAMIEAGVWDDPVKRQKVLKAYQEHDRASAR